MEDKFAKLKKTILEIEEDVNKFNNNNNKTAGLRIRKSMLDVKSIAQDIRKYILDKKNGNHH